MHIFLGFEDVPVMARIFAPTLQQASTAHFPNLPTYKFFGTSISHCCCYLYVFFALDHPKLEKLLGLKYLHGGARQPDSWEQIFAPTNQPASQEPTHCPPPLVSSFAPPPPIIIVLNKFQVEDENLVWCRETTLRVESSCFSNYSSYIMLLKLGKTLEHPTRLHGWCAIYVWGHQQAFLQGEGPGVTKFIS